MDVNRRGFLGALLAAATLDPERLLWRPGAKLISIPQPRPLVGQIGGYDIVGYDIVVEYSDGHLNIVTSYPSCRTIQRIARM